jgi:hypothetical protein
MVVQRDGPGVTPGGRGSTFSLMSTTIATPEEPERPKRRRSRSKRKNGEGSIWPRKDGRYGFAAYVPTTAGTFKRVQGYARS